MCKVSTNILFHNILCNILAVHCYKCRGELKQVLAWTQISGSSSGVACTLDHSRSEVLNNIQLGLLQK